MSSTTAKAGVALSLTFAAGFVDIVGYISLFQIFTAHMTGTTVHLAQDLVEGKVSTALVGVAVLGAFVGGSIVGRAVIEAAARRAIQRAASFTLVLEAVLIVVAMLLPPLADFRFAALVVLAAAMGLQTATLTRVGPLTVHTTFVTGMLNKLAQLVSHALFVTYDTVILRLPLIDHRRKVFREAKFIFSIWLLYLAGAAAGARLALTTSLRCLVVPVIIIAVAIVVDQITPLSLQEEKEELDLAA